MPNAQCISDPCHDHHDHHDHHDRPDRPDFHNHHDHHDHGDHEEVGGFTPASWRLSDHVCTHCRFDLSDGQWWINHSVRPICRYRATRAAKNLELNIKLVICSYFCSNSNIVFFIFNPSSLSIWFGVMKWFTDFAKSTYCINGKIFYNESSKFYRVSSIQF